MNVEPSWFLGIGYWEFCWELGVGSGWALVVGRWDLTRGYKINPSVAHNIARTRRDSASAPPPPRPSIATGAAFEASSAPMLAGMNADATLPRRANVSMDSVAITPIG